MKGTYNVNYSSYYLYVLWYLFYEYVIGGGGGGGGGRTFCVWFHCISIHLHSTPTPQLNACSTLHCFTPSGSLSTEKIMRKLWAYLVNWKCWWQCRHKLSVIDTLRAKFFRVNINMYLHFMSFLHIDMTQVSKCLPQIREGPTYPI